MTIENKAVTALTIIAIAIVAILGLSDVHAGLGAFACAAIVVAGGFVVYRESQVAARHATYKRRGM